MDTLRKYIKWVHKQRHTVHVDIVLYCSLKGGPFCDCVQLFKGGQKILDRQRFQYPPNWLYSDNVESEWMAFNDILKRKDAAMMTQIGHLQAKIVAEDKLMEQRAQEMLVDWETGKPIQVRPPTGCVCLLHGRRMSHYGSGCLCCRVTSVLMTQLRNFRSTKGSSIGSKKRERT